VGRSSFLIISMAAGLLASTADAGVVRASLGSPTSPAPTVACAAAAPMAGRAFAGPVLQVIDGETLCVAQGPLPKDWIRVRIAGAPAGSSRQTLMAASFGQVVACVAVKSARPGPEARCTLDGASMSGLIAGDAARRAGMTWR